ncbi:MAG: GFA family protein [Rhodospirillales bacterium]|nr:GFA family protein [Rhodospirillales bacterium]
MPVPFSGGCRCGNVRYECTAEPAMTVHCHCRDCQYATGSAFATVVAVPKEGFNMLKGEVKSFTVTATSGSSVSREFCTNCGSPLFSFVEIMPGMVFVKAGSLDDPNWLTPEMTLWTASAPPWAAHKNELPGIPGNPEM